ncbi:hypothetical protein ABZ671_32430 [Micromonospora sp. NPDC006766]|uniref:hypothetical protein n=1 Tax=Micromonospora sp. NPDC006766 TaxID=3154778 RepID=UPI0033C762D6
MYDGPTDADFMSWREHDDHAGDADEIAAEYRAEARQEAEQRHATATTGCATCGAKPGQQCNQDSPHPARMHAASLPCGTDCADCPTTLRLVPHRAHAETAGHWQGHSKIRVASEVYGVGYADRLALHVPGPEFSNPHVWPVSGTRHRYEPADVTATVGATLIIDGTAYQIRPAPVGIRIEQAPAQPPRPHMFATTAEEIAHAIGKALDNIDAATTALSELTDTAPEPGTPAATLATMRQRIRVAVADLCAVHQCAEDLTNPQQHT